MGHGKALVKGKWINESGDVTIILVGTENTDRQVVLFYNTKQYPGWHMGEEATPKELQKDIDDGNVYKIIVIEPGDKVLDAIPNDCAMTAL